MTATTTTDPTAPAVDTPQLDGMPPESSKPDTAPAKPKRARKPRAPRVTAPKPAAPSKGPGRPSKSAVLERQLTDLISLAFGVGGAVTAGPNGPGAPGTISADCMIVAAQAQPLAAALVKVSETNAQVRKALDTLVSTGAYSELLTIVIGGIALPIAANHGLLPGPMGMLMGAAAPAPAGGDDGAPTP